jgi:hypothetical protein
MRLVYLSICLALGICWVFCPLSRAVAQSRTVYTKPNATTEDFARQRAACLERAEIAKAGSADPNQMARAATWVTVYQACMRAAGWVLVPKDQRP